MSYEEVSVPTSVTDGRGPAPGTEDEEFHVMLLEPRPFRPFKTSEEYLYAMKEDLAEWLNALYELDITVDDFLERLETGVILCQHANNVLRMAREWHQAGRNGLNIPIPERDVVYRTDVQPGTFQSRDNVSNFITWCRKLDIKECLLFESDDLVLRKNEKSFILCLLEVARRGSKFGMPAPLLVQMEEEIDAELANGGSDCEGQKDSSLLVSPKPQIITNDLRSLHERVVDLLSRCTCPSQFPMIRVSEGKYRIGDTKVLIFVRILRNHVMVRVGGGWDTLEHYLDKHDPCRCKSGHRFSTSAKLTMLPGKGSPNMQVTYSRPNEPNLPTFHISKPQSLPSSPQTRRRVLNSTSPHPSQKDADDLTKDPLKTSQNSEEMLPSNFGVDATKLAGSLKPLQMNGYGHHVGHLDCAEHGEIEGGGREKKPTPLKIKKLGENGEESFIRVSKYDNGLVNGVECTGTSTERRMSAPQVPRDSRSPVPGSGCKVPTSRSGGRSKIPYYPDQPVETLSINQKSQSSENLYPGRYNDKVRTALISNSTPVQAIRKGRRSSDSSNYPLGMRRSRSHSSDSTEDGLLFFNRGTLGRHSYRAPRTSNIGSKEESAYKTWTFRQRSPRTSLSSDIFKPPSARSQSPARSPAPRMRSTDSNNTRYIPPQKKTSVKKPLLSPDKVQKLLKDVDFDKDHDFLAEMEKFIESYKAKVEKKLKEGQFMNFSIEDNHKRVQSTDKYGVLPDERPPSRGANPLQPSPPKSRSHSLGSSKIPMSVRYNKRE